MIEVETLILAAVLSVLSLVVIPVEVWITAPF